ncbi:MAG TPA: preprotein translocase subunit SecE [Isosphaeraceae bacterium]|jgi:preprotein translocase subunit SecE|nr:preprotein translocase subunit SecE [Isosphaeraceae bacterium]
MGKVKDDAPAKAGKPAPKGAATRGGGRIMPFLENLLRSDIYKPRQGARARTWTAVALGVLTAVGLLRLNEVLDESYGRATRAGLVGGLAVVLGWLIYRVVNFSPFADFLGDTQAEMNKVSWTSKEDLYRATMVVLTTVLLMSIFLFTVDQVWVTLLKFIGVLHITPSTPEG